MLNKRVLITTFLFLVVPFYVDCTFQAVQANDWSDCLYNKKYIRCKRIFLCPDAPCDTFKLEWKDGLKDKFTRYKDGMARNVGFYRDTRGGEWMLRGYLGTFGLKNVNNGNSIVYGMALESCKKSMLDDFCE